MSKTMNFICAAIGAAALVATPAFAAGQVDGHHAVGAKSAYVTTGHAAHRHVAHRSASSAHAQGLRAFAHAPSGVGPNDPTMYLMHHDIPVQDKTVPGMR